MAQPNLSVIQGKKADYSSVPTQTSSSVIKQDKKQKFIPLDKNTLTELSNRLHSYMDKFPFLISTKYHHNYL